MPVTAMRGYLVESYAGGSVVQEQRDRARLTAALGTGIRYVRTTFLPRRRDAAALRDAARHAALHYERIVEAVEGTVER